MVVEGVGNLAVQEAEHLVAPFDQRHANAERGHNAGVLNADHSAADHDQILGQ